MKLYLLPLVGLLLAGCTAEVLDESKDLVPVSLTVNISESAETRAGTSLLTAFSDEVLGIALTNCIDGSGAALASTTYTVGTGFASQPYISTDPATIKGYYPDSARTASSFSVQADQTSDDNYKASDLLYAETTATKAAPSPTLTFTHKMSKVIVNVTPTSGVSSVTSVTLNNINRTVAFTPATGVLGSLSNPGDITMSNEGAALIPPQTTNGDNNFLTIVTDVGTAYYKLAMEFVGGKVYTININVEKSSIGLTTTITNWDGATVNVDYNHGDGLARLAKLPIEYVAPYNLQTATTMATDNHKSHSGFFCWNNSTADFNGGGVGTVDISSAKANIQAMIRGTAIPGYHLPSNAEWNTVMSPLYADLNDLNISEGNERITYKNGQHLNVSETLAWGVTNNNGIYSYDVSQVFYNDYNCPNDAAHTYIGYGLRFKELINGEYVNGVYTCAYRYEYKSSDASVGAPSLTIKVTYVGDNADITISTISNESWWSSADYTVVLPGCGYSQPSNGSDKAAGWSSDQTANGYYWSATVKDVSHVYHMWFNTSNVAGNGWLPPGSGLSVRLFKDAHTP